MTYATDTQSFHQPATQEDRKVNSQLDLQQSATPETLPIVRLNEMWRYIDYKR